MNSMASLCIAIMVLYHCITVLSRINISMVKMHNPPLVYQDLVKVAVFLILQVVRLSKRPLRT